MTVDPGVARAGAGALRGAFAGICAALLFIQATPAPAAGPASPPRSEPAEHRNRGGDFNNDFDDWNDGSHDMWNDYNWTIWQMQREAISSQEEQSREAGRAARRDELEKTRAKDAAESEAYFQSILEASQAALRAPQGVYYRKPGYRSTEPPGPKAQTVEVGGGSYLYDQGIFWLQQGTEYLVVTAPAGAVVQALPPAAIRIPFGGQVYWYNFGTFFTARDSAYVVVKPPAGLTVYYLPDGYTQEKAGAADVFRFGDTLFKPVFVQGVLAYQVVAAQ